MLGKGGTGKTTIATLLAIFAAQSDRRVLLASLDPAHNLSDILEMQIRSEPTRIMNGFDAMEVNLDFWVEKYLQQTSKAIRRNYQYLTALNLDGYLDLYRHTPGLEEYGLMMVYRELTSIGGDLDYIIFDMPPTALSMQFFRLPALSAAWLEKLSDLRTQILEKRNIITRIKLGKLTIEQDKPLVLIQKRLKEFQTLKGNLQNPALNSFELICNPDTLSMNEAVDIAKKFNEWNFKVSHLLVNKSTKENNSATLPSPLKNLPVVEIKAAGQPLTGIADLIDFISRNRHPFLSFLPQIKN